MNSQRDNACKSLAKVSYGDIIIAPAVRFDEFHGLHKHSPGSTARISTGHVIDTMKRLQGL